MASYEQWHHASKDEPVKQILTSLWKGSRYLKVGSDWYVLLTSVNVYITQNPARLGLKLDSLTIECSVEFVKAYWSLSEHSALQVTGKHHYSGLLD